jgi:hypothetical protein
MLSIEQNDEIQMALLKQLDFPVWFVEWWKKINKLILFT